MGITLLYQLFIKFRKRAFTTVLFKQFFGKGVQATILLPFRGLHYFIIGELFIWFLLAKNVYKVYFFGRSGGPKKGQFFFFRRNRYSNRNKGLSLLRRTVEEEGEGAAGVSNIKEDVTVAGVVLLGSISEV